MNRILITSGPTREYLDPVRYLTNGSSGKMGVALANALLRQGNLPVIVSGPVSVVYPAAAEVHPVETTEQMLQCCLELFPHCTGVIGAAAPCDFRPVLFSEQKISKPNTEGPKQQGPTTGEIMLSLTETPDILAALGKIKHSRQWSVSFALETGNGRERALEKLHKKCSDFVVLNDPRAIGREAASFHIFDAAGKELHAFTGTKQAFSEELVRLCLSFSPCEKKKTKDEAV